ncbi:MAG: adenylate kinase [Thermoproteota archaeon]
MKIVLVSVPGGGKTTIMQMVKKELPEVKIVNYGDVMLKIAKERYGINDRDEMRKKIPVEEYKRLQLDAAKEIGNMKGDLIIDTHVSIKMQGGYYPGLPEEIAKAISPDVIIVTEYNPEDIIERRKKDMNLKQATQVQEGIMSVPRTGREIESNEEIEMHQTMNRLFAVAAANSAQSLLVILNLRFKQTREFEHAEISSKKIIEMFMKKSG